MTDYSHLEKRLDYTFKNKQLIIEALTHKSHKKPYNNERLEFLGDAVLDLIVGEYLYMTKVSYLKFVLLLSMSLALHF